MWKSAIQLIGRIRNTLEPGTEEIEITSARILELQELQEQLGYQFENLCLLNRALTHKSYAYEVKQPNLENCFGDYESLEFLGDSILGFIISEFLYLTYPEKNEGELSKLKSYLVSTRQLQHLSKQIGLGKFLNLSRGEAKTGGRKKKAILADLFESLVAAIYLDGDLEPVRVFVLKCYQDQFEKVARGELDFLDHKSILQEHLHQSGAPGPVYRVLEEYGPDHDKEFFIEVLSQGQPLASGQGKSKKEAEQNAAKQAMEAFRTKGPKASSKEPVS
ncbi:MAG: ribonuclease III [Acidobacteriota bacterium]|nr:MAG: ribonuclease III [Acidobacteriota bacterium]